MSESPIWTLILLSKLAGLWWMDNTTACLVVYGNELQIKFFCL